MFEIKRYTVEDKEIWNAYVRLARNATFLFDRNYMDYHKDRFEDHSLLIYKGAKLYALLPGNQNNNTFCTHQGLTYGGLIINKRATTADICQVFIDVNRYLKEQNFHHVIYKAIPWIYHQIPAGEDLYALTNVVGANLITRHIASTIVLDNKLAFTESRKSGIRKAIRAQLTVRECKADEISIFWNILNDNLHNKYGAKPVHTIKELQLLMTRFPDNIKCFVVFDGETALGGTLLYITPQVIHTQYISASPRGKSEGALDLLFDELIMHRKWDAKYFDFGKSSDGDGHDLNEPLIFQKEGFGGRGVCYDWYKWDL